tara:strand:+ start:1593 stop:1826 length:234 start_codon:yes stop_codon:yes gene_type:complete
MKKVIRIFKDKLDYEENKKAGENGVTQEWLDRKNLKIEDVIMSNSINCFNCNECRKCGSLYDPHDCKDYTIFVTLEN